DKRTNPVYPLLIKVKNFFEIKRKITLQVTLEDAIRPASSKVTCNVIFLLISKKFFTFIRSG
ncbi:MAG: hypothetical protein AAFY70_09040, partial [Bacteroidota bacterium]